MLLVHKAELNARLPNDFMRMDIRDLIKSDGSRSNDLPSPSYLLNRDHSTGSSHPASLYSSSGSLSLPQPVVGSNHHNIQPPSHTSNFSRANPLIWHTQGGFYVQAGQPTPPPQNVQQAQNLPLPHSHQIFDWPKYFTPAKRPSPPGDLEEGPPSKKSSTKWNVEENKLIIALRGQGMKWSDISRRIPGRTELACRLHYQNYLEKRGDWDEERKNKLARVYERMKEEMWKPVAAELGIPWRTAEGMHWIIGEQEMARRANVHPFSTTIQPPPTSSSNTTPTMASSRTYRRPSSSIIAFDEHEVATLRSPGMSPGSSKGPVSTFPSTITTTTGPPTYGIKKGSEFLDVPASEPIQLQPIDRECDPSFVEDENPKPASPTSVNYVNEASRSETGSGQPALLPSVAELEGGVSPFITITGRKGSTSSDISGRRGSNGRASPGLRSTTTGRIKKRPR